MEIINQTNRTILFDEINPEKLDLLTLVGDVKGLDSLEDEKIKEINGYLLVNDWDQFLDKFCPTVYSFYNAANQKVIYTLKKPENIPEDCISEIALDQNNDFLKMLITLIETKKSQGIENVDFKFEKITDMISPKKVIDDIKQVRKEIHYLHHEYEILDDGDPKQLDIGDKLNIKFEEASKNYNNVMAMLPLAIEDIKTRLLLGRTNEDDKAEKFQIGLLTMGEEGELKIIEAPKKEGTELMIAEENTETGLISAFEEDYENITDNPTDYVKNLVIRTFCPLPSLSSTEVDVVKEVANYNTYLEFYRDSKNDFIKVVKPLIEKIVGVKMFFEQYKSKNKGMVPSLLVVNCKLDMLVKSNNIPRLQAFLNTTNNKNDFANTIWFGIVSDIEFNGESNVNLRRERFKGNKRTVKADCNTMESLTTLLYSIQDYKIQTFFSFETCDETTFSKLSINGVEDYMEKTKILTRKDYSEYAVPCLPNFTIVPKNKSGVILDKKMIATEDGAEMSKLKEDIMKLWIEGVYISASYIASGIVAAYQCPEYLRTNFKNITKEYPGVRFDIEASDHALRVKTTLAKEISGFTNNIKDSINNRSYGFVFSSDNNQLEGKDVRQITVYKARSMQVVDNEYEAIYKTLVSTYVARMMRAQTSDYKHDNVVKFFSNNPASQKSKWMATRGFINSIVQDGDDINYEIEELYNLCNIDLTFDGNVKNLEVTISKESKKAV